jgi:hypothetical protein
MIKVTAGTTTSYFNKIVERAMTLEAFLAENNMSPVGATVQLDGTPISATSFSKTFDEMVGDAEECSLFVVVNAKNA